MRVLSLASTVFVVFFGLVASPLLQASYRLLSEDNAYEALNSARLNAKSLDFSGLKIAVVDRGFPGIENPRVREVIGEVKVVDTLSDREREIEKLEYISDLSLVQSADGHGLAMLQLALASSGAWWASPERRPSIYLIPARGIQNYQRAAQFIVDEGIDVVIHSRNLDWSSNLNGTGFLNAIVDQATSAGAIWINSAGNTGGTTFTSYKTELASSPFSYYQFATLPEEHKERYKNTRGVLRLPGPGNTVVFENKASGNRVDITLEWDDFTDSHLDATRKDLDFRLYTVVDDEDSFRDNNSDRDEDGDGLIPVQGIMPFEGERRQVGAHRQDGDDADITGHAFERMGIALSLNKYAIKVFARSEFAENKEESRTKLSANDGFRLTITSAQVGAVELKTQSPKASLNEITAPAGSVNAVAVGILNAPFSAKGRLKDGRIKPDVLLDLDPREFTSVYDRNADYKKPHDTSEAAALLGGVALAMKAIDPSFDKEALFAYIKQLPVRNVDSFELRVWQTETAGTLGGESFLAPFDRSPDLCRGLKPGQFRHAYSKFVRSFKTQEGVALFYPVYFLAAAPEQGQALPPRQSSGGPIGQLPPSVLSPFGTLFQSPQERRALPRTGGVARAQAQGLRCQVKKELRELELLGLHGKKRLRTWLEQNPFEDDFDGGTESHMETPNYLIPMQAH